MTKTAATVAAVQAVLVALQLLQVISLTADQLAGIVAATTAVLGAVAAWFSPNVPIGGGS